MPSGKSAEALDKMKVKSVKWTELKAWYLLLAGMWLPLEQQANNKPNEKMKWLTSQNGIHKHAISTLSNWSRAPFEPLPLTRRPILLPSTACGSDHFTIFVPAIVSRLSRISSFTHLQGKQVRISQYISPQLQYSALQFKLSVELRSKSLQRKSATVCCWNKDDVDEDLLSIRSTSSKKWKMWSFLPITLLIAGGSA